MRAHPRFQLRFWLFSFVPGTTAHVLYRDTVAFVNETEAFLMRNLGDYSDPPPRFPQPIPRDKRCCQVAAETMLAMMRSFRAAEQGGDPLAVFKEHEPNVWRLLGVE